MRTVVPFLTLAMALGSAATVMDRIGVIVGQRVVKTSDIERDLRLTEFLNGEPLDLSTQRKRQSAERLIDQQIIRTEIATGGYTRASDSQAEALLGRIRHDRFGESQQRLDTELRRYGLTENDLRAQLLWQLTVLDFIQQRFQPEVTVSDDDVHAYYTAHTADLRRQYGSNATFESLAAKIRSTLTGQGVNRQFEDWIARARQRIHIEYREGAFS